MNLDLSKAKQMVKDGTAPFPKLIMSNFGNPPVMGQKPLIFFQQVLAACVCPSAAKHFPQDVAKRAEAIRESMCGKTIASYQDIPCNNLIAKDICEYIKKRDGLTDEQAKTIKPCLTNGACEALNFIIRAGLSPGDAILTPNPGFPVYSALSTYFQLKESPYYLDEPKGWSVTLEALQEAHDKATAEKHVPKCIVLINPSNPTGAVSTYESIENALKFAYKHNMFVISDEVYQNNIYHPDDFPFVSARRVLTDLEMKGECKGLELFSIHSASKGTMAQCAARGGYFESMNCDDNVLEALYEIVGLGCWNYAGAIAMDIAVNPPKKGDESYELYNEEVSEIISHLKQKADILYTELNTWKNIRCQEPAGAMYVFPRLLLSEKCIATAASLGFKSADEMYAQMLVEAVGLIVLPAKIFGCRDDFYGFRLTTLPDLKDIEVVLPAWKKFHNEWMEKYN